MSDDDLNPFGEDTPPDITRVRDLPYSDDDNTTLVIGAALSAGLTVTVPLVNELQIDIDSKADYQRFEAMMPMAVSLLGAVITERRASRSGGDCVHITLMLSEPVRDLERVCLQAILGSDPKREFFGYRRIKDNISPVTMFIDDDRPIRLGSNEVPTNKRIK